MNQGCELAWGRKGGAALFAHRLITEHREQFLEAWHGGVAPGADERIADVKVTRDTLSVNPRERRIIMALLAQYPHLFNSAVAQRKTWRVAGGGYDMHRPDIDQNLSIEGLLRGAPAPRSAQVPAERPAGRQPKR